MTLVTLIFGTLVIVGGILILVLVNVFRPRKNEDATNKLIPDINIPLPPKKKFKRCPACQSTFTDENLNYCLSDGTLLEGANAWSDEMETVVRRFK